MRCAWLLPLALVLLLPAAGCTTTAPEAEARTAAPREIKSAFLYVDGRQRGVTPAEVRVRRNLGRNEVTLRVGPKLRTVRRYEFEYTPGSGRVMLDYTFGQASEGGIQRIYASDLPSRKKGRIVTIPYYDRPILIVDREYQLSLYVED